MSTIRQAQPSLDNYLWFSLPHMPFSGARTVGDKLLLGLVKIVRLQPRAASDFPQVQRLTPFRCSLDEVPERAQGFIAERVQALVQQGFAVARIHRIRHPLAGVDSTFITLVHSSGGAFARVTCHLGVVQAKPRLFSQFWSLSTEGQVTMTWARGCELRIPEQWRITTQRDADDVALWDAHRRSLSGIKLQRLADAELDMILDSLQLDLVATQLAAKIFRPLTDDERRRQGELLSGGSSTARTHQEALAEFERLQQVSGGLRSKILLLLVSLGAFVVAGMVGGGWGGMTLVLLVVVLFVHESGHFVAMRLSGYRNLKMFFIPFFGAAVSGQSWNVPGWKRVVVSLAGPVPGIVIGCVLAFVALETGSGLAAQAALLFLIINGFNLLPLLPLDGGWVAHHLLFSRQPVLDVAFRGLAVVGLLVLSVVEGSRSLAIAAVFTAISLPVAWSVARAVARLRAQGYVPQSEDGVTLPADAAIPVLDVLQESRKTPLAPLPAAQQALMVCENLASRAPGWGLTSGLLAVHGLVLVMAVVGVVVGGVGMFNAKLHEGMPVQHRLVDGDMVVVVASAVPATVTLVAPLSDHAAAQALAAGIRAHLPADASCLVVVDHVLIGLPAGAVGRQQELLAELHKSAKQAWATSEDNPFSIEIGGTPPRQLDDLTQLDDLLACSEPKSLIAPWDNTDPRTSSQRVADGARRALVRQLVELEGGSWSGLSAKSMLKTLIAARLKSKQDEDDTIAQRQQRREQKRKEAIDRLISEQPREAAALTAYRDAGEDDRDAVLVREFGPRLGVVKAGEANRLGLAAGWIDHADGWQATLSFNDPVAAIPPLLRWLDDNRLAKVSVATLGATDADEAASTEPAGD